MGVPVRLRGVTKRYGSTSAVSDLDLEVNRAEVFALLGPNGAGKTTTVEMCEGFVRPDAGSVEVLGLDPIADNAQVRARIGVMLQGGGGLVFSRLVAPFVLTPDALTLTDARAFSASLGMTAKGRILLDERTAKVEGTIVPAYMFNALLGHLPVVGRLFSPESGGGVFAATFRVQGKLADPQVSVNPLAALTPGFLRGIFGLGRGEEAK